MAEKVVAIINQKGGVGKTTTSINLTHALARSGKKVTVIDLDPQRHLALSLGFVNPNIPGIDEVMMEAKDISNYLMPVRENLQIIAAGVRLQEIEQLSETGSNHFDLLGKSLAEKLLNQDYVFIDCPPSSGSLVANALYASDQILIPMTGDFLALQGLSQMMGTIKQFEKRLNKKYELNLVMSRYASSRRISKEVLNTMLQHFPDQILNTVIRETAVLAECPGFGKSILEYRPKSCSAIDFTNLANDFLLSKVM